MSGIRKGTRVLALPVFRKNWLYAVEEAVEDLKPLRSWREGATLGEKAQLGQAQLTQEVHKRILNQWADLKAAPAGSFRNRLYGLAVKALEQEDVSETFLKTLPLDTDRYDVIYPSSTPERYIRRRTRHFLRQQEYLHWCRRLTWGIATLPAVPFALLPLPNIPLYYAGYRVYSHNKALKGCRKLLESIQSQGANVRSSSSHAGLVAAAASHSSSPAALANGMADAASNASKVSGASGNSSGGGSKSDGSSTHNASAASQPPPPVYLLPDEDLTQLLEAHQRQQEPVCEKTATMVGERFGFPDLPSLVRRSLKSVAKADEQAAAPGS